jgi:hypothetical protein
MSQHTTTVAKFQTMATIPMLLTNDMPAGSVDNPLVKARIHYQRRLAHSTSNQSLVTNTSPSGLSDRQPSPSNKDRIPNFLIPTLIIRQRKNPLEAAFFLKPTLHWIYIFYLVLCFLLFPFVCIQSLQALRLTATRGMSQLKCKLAVHTCSL